MRILLALANLRATGALTMGHGLLSGLAQLPADHEYLVLHPDGCGYEELLAGDARFESMPVSDRGGLLQYKLGVEQLQIPRLIRRQRVDALLTFNTLGCWWPPCTHLVLVQFAHLAYRLDELDFPQSWRFKTRYALRVAYFRQMLAHTDAVVVQTDVMQQRMVARWQLDPASVHVVPPGINLDVAEAQAAELPEAVRAIGHERLLLTYLAAPMAHKNFAVLPRALAQLVSAGLDAVLALSLPAEHPMMLAVFDEARQLGCADRLLALGPLDHAVALALLQRSFCALMPTLLETIGLPYLEAMACGCPVVTSDRDFARSALGDAGLYANPHDPAALAAAVAALQDPEVRQRQVEAGKARLSEKFAQRTWMQMASEYLQAIEQAHASRIGRQRSSYAASVH